MAFDKSRLKANYIFEPLIDLSNAFNLSERAIGKENANELLKYNASSNTLMLC